MIVLYLFFIILINKDLEYSIVDQHTNIELHSDTKSYIHNDKFYVQTTDNSKILKIDILKQLEDSSQINAIIFQRISNLIFSSPIRCSSLSYSPRNISEPPKCIVGLERSAEVRSITNRFSQVLNTKSSAALCVLFKPDENQSSVFVGCRNKFLYGYDLRSSTKVKHFYEHSSCVSDIVMDHKIHNNLISSDNNGQIYLWDLRMNQSICKFKDYENKCSIQLSKCGTYLFSSMKIFLINKIICSIHDLSIKIICDKTKERYEINSKLQIL